MVSYKPLWVLLVQRDMTKADFRRETGISSNTLTRMNKGEEISLSLLNKICAALKCNYSDIIEYIPDGSEAQEK